MKTVLAISVEDGDGAVESDESDNVPYDHDGSTARGAPAETGEDHDDEDTEVAVDTELARSKVGAQRSDYELNKPHCLLGTLHYRILSCGSNLGSLAGTLCAAETRGGRCHVRAQLGCGGRLTQCKLVLLIPGTSLRRPTYLSAED